MSIEYVLPDQALASCDSPGTKIDVYWENNKHLIVISQNIPRNNAVLIRPR